MLGKIKEKFFAPGTPMKGVPFFFRLHFKIAAGVIFALLLTSGVFFYVTYRMHKDELIENIRNSTTSLSSVVQQGLEKAMLVNDLALLQRMLEEFGKDEAVRSIFILNKQGEVRFSSDKSLLRQPIDISEPTCQLCHKYAAEDRAQTVVFKTPDNKEVFRSVRPIRNQKACYMCHGAQSRLNGVLIIDYSMDRVKAELLASEKKFSLVTILMTALSLGLIGLLMNKLVLRKLERFARVTRLVGEGDLNQVVKIEGRDELAQLSHHFNQMMEKLKQSMAEVTDHKEYLEGLINSIEDGLVVIDKDYKVVSANQAFLYNFAKGNSVLGRYCHQVTACQESPAWCPARNTFQSGDLGQAIHTFYDQEKGERHVEIYSTPVRTAKGEISQVIEVWRDITERKKLEASLAHSERLASLGLLASGFSHEINTPLASISACIEGIKRRIKSAQVVPEVREYLDLVQKETLRCKGITDKLLFLSRQDRSRPALMEINKAVRDVLSLMKPEAEAKAIGVREELGPDLPLTMAAENQIKQVLLNLILNAVQAMDGGGILTVSTRKDEGFVRISVADTGGGISLEDLNRVFDPFFTRKPAGQGTGLGLFVSHGIVKEHKGEIKVESQLGKGSRFTVILPISGAEGSQNKGEVHGHQN